MGNNILCPAKLAYWVDEDAPDRMTSIGFSPNMFVDFEWASLKTFCKKRRITQTELNLLFKRHCTYKNAHVCGYRVRLEDIKEHFLKETRITMVRVVICFVFYYFSPPLVHI
jgi:hypothetical protein